MASSASAVVLELHKKVDSGKIWQHDHRQPDKEGTMLRVQHSRHGQLPLGSQLLRFMQVAFDPSGTIFAAADQLGNIFIFDIPGNSHTLLCKMDLSCTALCFSAVSGAGELLVGVADNSFRSYDLEYRRLKWHSMEHKTCVHSISINPANPAEALTTSADEALLWDLDSFTIKRALNGAHDIGIQQAIFSPSGEFIITCFKNDEIVGWDVHALQVAFKLHPPKVKHSPGPRIRTITCSRDGRLLVAAGRSKSLHVWNLSSSTLLRKIDVPDPVNAIKRLQFVWMGRNSSQMVVAALGDTGQVHLIDVENCELVHAIGSGGNPNFVDAMAICPHGRFMSVVLSAGTMALYDVDVAVTQRLREVTSRPKVSKPRKPTVTRRAQNIRKDQALPREKSGYADTKFQRYKLETFGSFEQMREEKLNDILAGFGEYPKKYRKYIWRQLLQLPENLDVYNNLLNKGVHSNFKEFHQTYPMKSRKLLRISQRNLSALAHWAPILAETSFLPHLAFPFLKFFENTPFISFEVIMTVAMNWCQQWFEFFPNPPINVLNMLENVLTHHDPVLQKHLLRYGITSQVYGWPLLQSMLSDTFEGEDWLAIWDNLFSNHPGFLLIVVVAYIVLNRVTLLKCKAKNDFQYFFSRQTLVEVDKVIKKARSILKHTPRAINPTHLLAEFVPLSSGQYPVFNNYPAFIVDYQVNERERIRQEELEFLHQRTLAIESRKQIERMKMEEQAWNRQQELLLEAEAERRRRLQEEEGRLNSQRRKLDALRQDQLVQELKAFEASKRNFVDQQQKVRLVELQRIDDKISQKKLLRSQETSESINDAVTRTTQLGIRDTMAENQRITQAAQTDRFGTEADSGASDAAPEDPSFGVSKASSGYDSLSRVELLTGALNRDRLNERRAYEQEQIDLMDNVRKLRQKVVHPVTKL